MNEMLISALVAQLVIFLLLITRHGKTAFLMYLSSTGLSLAAFAVWGNAMTIGEGAAAALFFIASVFVLKNDSIARLLSKFSNRTRTLR